MNLKHCHHFRWWARIAAKDALEKVVHKRVLSATHYHCRRIVEPTMIVRHLLRPALVSQSRFIDRCLP